MSKATSIPRLLRKAMAERELSEEGAAQIVGCLQGTLNRWLHGWTSPGVRHLKGISRLTGVPIEKLVDLYEKANA